MHRAARDIRDLAYYLAGLNDAFLITGLPDWIDETAFLLHVDTARRIHGGAEIDEAALAMAEFCDWYNKNKRTREMPRVR